VVVGIVSRLVFVSYFVVVSFELLVIVGNFIGLQGLFVVFVYFLGCLFTVRFWFVC